MQAFLFDVFSFILLCVSSEIGFPYSCDLTLTAQLS